MSGPELIMAFLRHASSKGSRSTVLKPLGWLIPMLLSSMLISFYIGSPSWVSVLLVVFNILTVALYFFTYMFCLFKDRDALRSEKFSIQKMAIEKGYLGDDSTGLLNPSKNIDLLVGSHTEVDPEDDR